MWWTCGDSLLEVTNFVSSNELDAKYKSNVPLQKQEQKKKDKENSSTAHRHQQSLTTNANQTILHPPSYRIATTITIQTRDNN